MFFVVVGIICFLIGGFLVYVRLDRIKNCKPYLAKMINIEEKRIMRSGIIRIVYRAVVSYNTATLTQRANHFQYMNFPDYSERYGLGEEFTVYVDPRISNVFYFRQDIESKVSFGAVLSFALGVFFVIVGCIFVSRGL